MRSYAVPPGEKPTQLTRSFEKRIAKSDANDTSPADNPMAENARYSDLDIAGSIFISLILRNINHSVKRGGEGEALSPIIL